MIGSSFDTARQQTMAVLSTQKGHTESKMMTVPPTDAVRAKGHVDFLNMPMEVQRLIIKEYYAEGIIRAAAHALPGGSIVIIQDHGPLRVNKSVRALAVQALKEVKCDTFIFTHDNLYKSRKWVAYDQLYRRIEALKIVAKDIKLIINDYGPMVRYSRLSGMFPNIRKVIFKQKYDVSEHAIVFDHRHGGFLRPAYSPEGEAAFDITVTLPSFLE